jgi:hypothetical protein
VEDAACMPKNEHNNVLKITVTIWSTMANSARFASRVRMGMAKITRRKIFCLLNLFAFQFHTILGLVDENYMGSEASLTRPRFSFQTG